MKGMRNITLIAAMVLTLAAFGCSSTGTNDQVVDNAPGTVQNDSPTIASNADAGLGAATVPTGGVDADSRNNMSDNSANTRAGQSVATNQMTPSVPSQGLALPDNRPNTVATTQTVQSTTTYNTPVTAPAPAATITTTTEQVDTTASMSTETVPAPTTTITTTETTTTTTDQSMTSSAQTDDTTDDDTTTTRRRMRKD